MQLPNIFQPFISKVSIGIDIGNFSVKVAQIKQRRFPNELLLSFGIKEIKPEKSHDAIVQAIKEACSDAKIESNKVNLSIYGSGIIVRYISLPQLETDDLAHCMEFELERHIPGDRKNNMIIDYKILYRLPTGQMTVILIAAEQRKIEERISFVRDVGLIPTVINIDALALMDAFKATQLHSKDKGITAILDIGHSVSKLTVFQDNVPYFSRDIDKGVYDLVRIATDRMNVDYSLVNELVSNDPEKSKALYDAIKVKLNDLVDELRLSFEYCWRHLQKKVEHLYLSGGGSKLKIIKDVLATNLSLKTDILDVTENFRLPSHIKREDLKDCGSLLTVAIGLASQG